MYSEDQAWIGAFNFRLQGFKDPPTFKYLRSWWQRSEDLRATDKNRADSCPIKYAFEYLRNFYKEYSEELSFSYLSTSALSHNKPEKIQMYDEEFLEFFTDLKKSKQLDSTFVIFFGDHGMREGSFRHTKQGQLEERLPFMSITVPDRFIKEHPIEFNNLKHNSKVLTTPYDMHITLKHLLSISRKPEKHVFGRSLFTDIVKENRSCSNAGVPHNWCVCGITTSVPSDDDTIKLVAKEMVDEINNLMQAHDKTKNSCEEFSLLKIIRAGVLDQPSIDNDAEDYATYEVVFQVTPGHGIFEGTAEYDKENKRTRVNKDFSRLNIYGDQPHCIAKEFPYLRKFCYCKDQMAVKSL